MWSKFSLGRRQSASKRDALTCHRQMACQFSTAIYGLNLT
jgi:hypothetical protein